MLIRGTGRMIKALAALIALASLLAALPYGLIRFVGDPLPRGLPTVSGIQNALTSPPPDTFYIDVLACLLWLCWLVLAVSFVVELIYALRRVHAPHIPGLGPGQFVTAALIAAVGLGAGTAHPAAAAATSSPLPASHLVAASSVRPAAADAGAAPASVHVAATATHADGGDSETVTVKPGDTLYGIAQSTLGDGKDWPALYRENAGRPQPDGARLTNPDLIRPGWTILIDPTNSGSASLAAPHAAPAAPKAPVTSPTSPTPPLPHATDPASIGSNSGRQQQDKSTDSVRPASQAPRHAPPRAVRVDLAEGGAIAGSLMLALLAALALTRLYRRRFSSPFWPVKAVAVLHDELPPALRPAPPTVGASEAEPDELDEFGAPTAPERITELVDANFEALAKSATDDDGHLHLEADEGGTPAAEDSDPVFGSRIAVAHTDFDEITLDQLPGGMGLTGPGALGAARAIAAAILTDGAAENRLERARLIMGRDDLALLLECDAAKTAQLIEGVAELDVVDDLAAALALFEEHLAYRARLLEEYDCADLTELAERRGDLEPHPPLVLLGLARHVGQARLAATAAAGASMRAHLILLGSHPDQPTWHIAAGAEITGEPDVRLHAQSRAFDLPADALRQALRALAQASGHHLRRSAEPEPPDPIGPLAAPLGFGSFTDPDAAASTAPASQDLQGTNAARLQEGTSLTPNGEQEKPADAAAWQPPANVGLPPLHVSSVEKPSARGNSMPAPAPALVSVAEGPTVERSEPMSPETAESSDAAAALLADFDGKIVRIRVLGPLLLEDADGPITTGLRANSRRLAARLAVHHRRGQSSDELAELWPDLSGKELSDTRKTAMAYLRGPLRKATGATSAQFVLDTSGRYCLDANLVGVDLAVFDGLRRLAARSRDPRERATAAEAALELYRGELLAGYDEPWIEPLRTGVRRDALACAALLAQLAVGADDLEAALHWWESARAIDDNEEVYRQIMKTQAALGRRVDVIATRDMLIAKLESIGEYPSARTEQLLGELIRERPTAGKVAPQQARGPARVAPTPKHGRPVREPAR